MGPSERRIAGHKLDPLGDCWLFMPRLKKQVRFACDFFAGIKILWCLKILKWSMAASKTTVGGASLDGAEDVQKSRCVLHAAFVQVSRFF